ncbi:MAG: hypothetical protein RL685_2625 [Pseudomonadota bacterium]|jgi:beta-lactamase regulating signal transducer with metallopeptidase domain
MIHLALFGVGAAGAMVLTYLLHSTLWIAGAALLTHFHRGLSASARHVVWRAALLGPFGSSASALALGHRWQWALTSAPAASEGWASAAPALAPLQLRDVPFSSVPFSSVPFSSMPASDYTWSALLATAWAVVALAGLLLLARAFHRQRRALALRTLVTHVTSIEALERLRRRAGLRAGITLSRCAQASSPLVLSSREICLPERAAGLDAAALEAVLAHEIAHIERRDGLWQYTALVLQALLWFQPLNRRVRAQLQETAELAADARAVELTGDALGLARTLTLVASWHSAAEPEPLVAMARAGSLIVERVVRLVEVSDAHSGARRSRTPWFALAALAAIGACSPSVGAPKVASLPATEPSTSPAGALRDGSASELPNPVAFGRSLAKLAKAEHELRENILSIERRLAAQGVASGTDQPGLEGLRCELADTTATRLRITRDFEARVKDFEREQRAHWAAGGEQ